MHLPRVLRRKWAKGRSVWFRPNNFSSALHMRWRWRLQTTTDYIPHTTDFRLQPHPPTNGPLKSTIKTAHNLPPASDAILTFFECFLILRSQITMIVSTGQQTAEFRTGIIWHSIGWLRLAAKIELNKSHEYSCIGN